MAAGVMDGAPGPVPEMVIRPAEQRDAADFADYVALHVAESGKDGMPIFAPGGKRASREEARDNAKLRWAKDLADPQWGRAWLLLPLGKREVVGHVELRGGRIAAELHRATLGMGILRAFTRRGLGRLLLDAAVGWARSETELAWIDLGVFAGNGPAIKLYERFGFAREFVREDAFRNEDGTTVDDIMMTLRLR